MGKREHRQNPTIGRFPFFCVMLLGLLFSAGSCEPKKVVKTPNDSGKEKISVEKNPVEKDPTETFDKKDAKLVGPKTSALFFLSGLKGYTEPCGCTLDIMMGGIDRVVGYHDDAKKLYTSSEMLMAGDTFFEHPKFEDYEVDAEKARVQVVLSGLKRLAPKTLVPGPSDFALGADAYMSYVKQLTSVTVLGANVTVGDVKLASFVDLTVDGAPVRVIGVVDPALFKETKGIKVTDPVKAFATAKKSLPKETKGATTIALVVGTPEFTRPFATKVEADFFVVSHKPRETDQVDTVGNGFVVEPHDQGRYFGILSLYEPKKAGPFSNGKTGSSTELDKVQKQIEYVNGQVASLPPATPGTEPPMLLNLRKRITELKARAQEIKNAKVEIAKDKKQFLWRPVGLDPGYREDAKVKQTREAFNKSLKSIVQKNAREPIPAEPGKPFYIGSDQCGMCHQDAKTFWDETAHGRAFATLEKRDKDFDANCVGCHTVGYDKPGGSVVGMYAYDAEIPVEGNDPIKFTKNLKDVGCENCHGPGSMHRGMPTDAEGKPQFIQLEVEEATCQTCHVPDHSPKFNYNMYRTQILGKGHGVD